MDIEKVAAVAKIHLDEQAKEMLAKDLEIMFRHLKQLKEVNVDNVEPTFTMGESKNLILYPDVPHKSLSREIVFESAPSVQDGYFKVPREPKGS